MAKSWTPQETAYMGRYARKKTLAELAQRFDAEADDLRAKLAEMNLRTKDGEPAATRAASIADDPEVKVYEKAIEAVHAKKWKKAEELLEEVIADSDRPELIERARQHLTVVHRHTGAGDGGDRDADPYTEAVFEKNRGGYAAAREIVAAHAKRDDDGRFAYLAASLHALEGQGKEAAKALDKAIAADPANRVRAFHDPDLAELRKDKDHAHLFGLD